MAPTYAVGYLTHALVVPLAAVCRTASDYHLGLVLVGQTLHLIIIHTAGLTVEVVAYRLVDDAARIHQRTMTEVPAVVQIESHEGVARIENSQEDSCIGLCTRVRLHIGILCTEEGFYSVDSQLLHLIHHLTASVVSLAGITLGILVGQARTQSLHDLIANEVLRGDKLNAAHLSLLLLINESEHRVVSFHNLSPSLVG